MLIPVFNSSGLLQVLYLAPCRVATTIALALRYEVKHSVTHINPTCGCGRHLRSTSRQSNPNLCGKFVAAYSAKVDLSLDKVAIYLCPIPTLSLSDVVILSYCDIVFTNPASLIMGNTQVPPRRLQTTHGSHGTLSLRC